MPLLIWQQVEAPEYRKGFITVAALATGLCINSMEIRALVKRDKKKGEGTIISVSEDSVAIAEEK